jgi:hypothetical protein
MRTPAHTTDVLKPSFAKSLDDSYLLFVMVCSFAWVRTSCGGGNPSVSIHGTTTTFE